MNKNLETTITKTIERIKELEEKIKNTNNVAIKHRLKAELKIQLNSLEAYRLVSGF